MSGGLVHPTSCIPTSINTYLEYFASGNCCAIGTTVIGTWNAGLLPYHLLSIGLGIIFDVTPYTKLPPGSTYARITMVQPLLEMAILPTASTVNNSESLITRGRTPTIFSCRVDPNPFCHHSWEQLCVPINMIAMSSDEPMMSSDEPLMLDEPMTIGGLDSPQLQPTLPDASDETAPNLAGQHQPSVVHT